MSITPELVEHVARLARLELSPDELTRYTGDLGNILKLVDQLNELDLDAVSLDLTSEEAARVPTVFREDAPTREFDRDALLALAPQEEDGYYRVPRILSE